MNDTNSQMIEHLIEQLKLGNTLVSWKAGINLGAFGVAAVKPLISMFQDAEVESNLFRNVVNVLRRMGQDALDDVITALNNDNEDIRFGAAYTLGYQYEVKLNEPRRRTGESEGQFLSRITYTQRNAKPLGSLNSKKVTRALIKLLKDEAAKVRAEAAKTLGIIGNPSEALPALVEILLKDEDSQVRADAAEALHDLEDTKAITPLISALSDSDKWVRYSVIRALGHLESTDAFEPIARLLKIEDDKVVARIAASMLIELDQELAIPMLVEALKDEKAAVRAAASLALNDLGEQSAKLVAWTDLEDG